MKKIILILAILFIIVTNLYCGNWPEFTGVWMYSDYSIAAENMTVYEISPDSFYVTVSIFTPDDSYEESVELDIIEYDEYVNHIKTKVISKYGSSEIFDIKEGNIVYWVYKKGEGGIMYFDFSTEEYPLTAENGPFEPSDYAGERNPWAEFAGTWYWMDKTGTSSRIFVFSDIHHESDLAVLELYAEGEGSTGYALFEIPAYNEIENTIRLMCLDSDGSLSKYKIGTTWYFTYIIHEGEAYFEFSSESYPAHPSDGPYFIMTSGM